MPSDLPDPQNGVELITNPALIRRAWAELKAAKNMEVHLVPPGNVPPLGPGNKPIRGTAPNWIMALPLQFPKAYAAPTGTLSRVTFNADETTAISSPPTQAQVQSVQNRLTATRRILAAVITDLQATRMAPTV